MLHQPPAGTLLLLNRRNRRRHEVSFSFSQNGSARRGHQVEMSWRLLEAQKRRREGLCDGVRLCWRDCRGHLSDLGAGAAVAFPGFGRARSDGPADSWRGRRSDGRFRKGDSGPCGFSAVGVDHRAVGASTEHQASSRGRSRPWPRALSAESPGLQSRFSSQRRAMGTRSDSDHIVFGMSAAAAYKGLAKRAVAAVERA